MADGAVFSRVPPNSLDAEAAVLSACLLDKEQRALDEARDTLTPRDFYADANRRIFEAILALDAAGQPADVVTVAERLRSEGRLNQVGGTPYLAQLSDATPSIANVGAHARIITQKARQRRVVELGQCIVAEGYGEVEDARAWSLDAAQRLSDIAAEGDDGDPTEGFDVLVPRVLGELTERKNSGQTFRGVDTGWRDMNRALSGWERGKLHIVGGRPGMGKTAFVMGACLNVASKGLPVVFVSAEMKKEELVERCFAVEADVGLGSIRSATLDDGEWASLAAASSALARYPLAIKYKPGATIADIRGVVRKERRARGALGLIVVDYIQVLNGERRDGDSRESEVAALSRRLMWMAAEFDAPLLAVSQLNRSVESRSNANKRPGLGDLRESGAIEQDAYTVTLLYRDDYYDKASGLAGTMDAIVAKNRNGPTSTVRLAFKADSTRVADLARGGDWDSTQEDWHP